MGRKILAMIKKDVCPIEDLKIEVEQLTKDSSSSLSLQASTFDLRLIIRYNETTHRTCIEIVDYGHKIWHVVVRDLWLILHLVQVSNDHSFKSNNLDVTLLPTGDLLFGF